MSTEKDLESDSDEYRESEDEDYDPSNAGPELQDEEDIKEVKKLDQTYNKYQGKGGLIKTRAQRRREENDPEYAKAKALEEDQTKAPVIEKSSIDVDALWGEMNSAKPAKPATQKPELVNENNENAIESKQAEQSAQSKQSSPTELATAATAATAANSDAANSDAVDSNAANSEASAGAASGTASASGSTPRLQEEYIEIKRTFKFAGEVKTETKRVLKSSAEGQDFLRQQQELKVRKSQGRGPVKRKMSLQEEYNMNKTKKINTLEKSRLDWLGFVDKEDIREDLTKHNKAGYLDRQSFLNKVDEKVETDLRSQRAKSMR